MASKRIKGKKWEFLVKRAGLLPKPLYLTFETETEGDDYCRRLEALLDRGIVPLEYQAEVKLLNLGDLIDLYLRDHAVKPRDVETLSSVRAMVAKTPLTSLDVSWVDGFVTRLKREEQLAPSTIRAKVGSLARCTDWGVRKKHLIMPDHPFRTLPVGYANYTEQDSALAGGAKSDKERERRLMPGEHEKILEVIRGGVIARKFRPYIIENKEAVERLYILAIESAMRLSEMYSLSKDQVSLTKRGVYLTKTKNGDSRQVPLSSVSLVVMRDQLAAAEGDEVFPWWKPGDDRKRTSSDLSKLFSRIFDAAGCGDLHFHDLRHEATSRFFERTTFSSEKIMKITGHRSHRMVMRYLNLRASELADGLW